MNAIRFSRVFLPLFGGALLVIALLLFLLPFGAQAKPKLSSTGVTRYVSPTGDDIANTCTNSNSPCRTVQHAIDASQDGDEVRVAQGTYTGTMAEPRSAGGAYSATVVLTKNLSAFLGGYSTDFSTRNPEANETILSAVDTPRKFVVFISNTTTLVDGFTMTGATGACPTDCVVLQYNGGAIWIRNGSPTISHNRIQGNRAYYNGGGIYIGQNATPIIASNIIYSNTASFHEDGGGLGGGIYVGSGSAIITDNVIISNVADVEGGGIFTNWNVPTTIVSNTIAYNQAISSTIGRGGGVRTVGDLSVVTISYNDVYSNESGSAGGLDISSPAIVDSNYVHHNQGDAIEVTDVPQPVTVTNNVIAHNQYAGVWIGDFSEVRIVNNTIVYNGATGADAYVIAEHPISPSLMTIKNNIIAFNACGVYRTDQRGGLTLVIEYNDVVGNDQDGNYCFANPPVGLYNISATPQFVNVAAGDYRIRFGSPAMNTGTNTNAPIYDRDGVIRPQMGRVDMGAYEVVAPYSIYLPTVLK